VASLCQTTWGVITLVLPDGVPAEALVAGEAKPAAKGKPACKPAGKESLSR
jgi:hypothetical protein